MGALWGRPLQPYTVVVTGAGTGIGEATALALNAAGFTVVAGVLSADEGKALSKKSSSGRLRTVVLDVTKAEDIAAMRGVVEEVAGAGRVGLVCSAGIAVLGPIETVPMEDFKRCFDVNVHGSVACAQALLPLIRPSRGRIVLIASMAGRYGLPFWGPYCGAPQIRPAGTKFALEGIGDSLRRELLPHGCGVAIVEPFFVRTGMVGDVPGMMAPVLARSPEYGPDVMKYTYAPVLAALAMLPAPLVDATIRFFGMAR
eukprot:tig00020710_g13266.t1